MSDTSRKLSLNKLSLKRDAAGEQPKLEERLHKVLAQAGLGSRRALEQRIADGLVKVNGEVAQTGMSVKSGDRIELDGRSFVASALTEPARVLIYNKPEGEVITREDPEGRPTIFEALPALKGARWIAIGRLDINTTGLLLLTTDGEMANAMMHPSYEIEREYVVRVRAPEGEDKVPDSMVERLSRGVLLEDGGAKFDEIERIGGTDSHDWFRVVVKEGRNREVRRLWESQGCQVSRLKRTRYGKVGLPRELLRGQSLELAQDKVEALRAELKLEEGTPSALTLQPVIGQRKAAKATVQVGRGGNAYVNGHNVADEGRELRRFDNFREDRGRGRGVGCHEKQRGDKWEQARTRAFEGLLGFLVLLELQMQSRSTFCRFWLEIVRGFSLSVPEFEVYVLYKTICFFTVKRKIQTDLFLFCQISPIY
jgi:23S rRNA pseudouridine2605 synthase